MMMTLPPWVCHAAGVVVDAAFAAAFGAVVVIGEKIRDRNSVFFCGGQRQRSEWPVTGRQTQNVTIIARVYGYHYLYCCVDVFVENKRVVS